MPVRAGLIRVVHQGRQVWWKVRRPSTYGVKALVIHPGDSSRCLVVRHSYVDREWWALPGGGYKPARETALEAAVREVEEELALELTLPTVLETLTSTLEGKVDSLTIVRAQAVSEEFRLSAELTEARWVSTDLADLPEDAPVSRWLRLALAANGAD